MLTFYSKDILNFKKVIIISIIEAVLGQLAYDNGIKLESFKLLQIFHSLLKQNIKKKNLTWFLSFLSNL